MIQLHRLEGFYWVARTGGYSKAARAFPYPITQPAVHQQVKKLEQELGVGLFERVGKDRMQVTLAGQQLYDFCRPFFEQLPSVISRIESGNYGGRFHIRAQGIMLRHLLPSWLKRLSRKLNDLHIHLEEMTDFDLGPLKRGEADMVVAYVAGIPEGIASEQIASLYPFLVMPNQHPAARRKRRAVLEDFTSETFISYPSEHLAAMLQAQVLAAHGITPDHILSAGSADTIIGFVEAGLGFSLVPSLDPKGPRGRGIHSVPIELEDEFPVYAMWRLDTPENPILDAAIETAPKLV